MSFVAHWLDIVFATHFIVGSVLAAVWLWGAGNLSVLVTRVALEGLHTDNLAHWTASFQCTLGRCYFSNILTKLLKSGFYQQMHCCILNWSNLNHWKEAKQSLESYCWCIWQLSDDSGPLGASAAGGPEASPSSWGWTWTRTRRRSRSRWTRRRTSRTWERARWVDGGVEESFRGR